MSKFKIEYQDEDLLVINKSCNIHVLSQAQQTATSLSDLIHDINPAFQLLQRLDYPTSGCLIVAKHEQAFQVLKEQIRQHELTKEYLMITEGKFKSQKTENYLGSRYRGSKKVSISSKGKERFLYAMTDFQLEQHFPKDNFSLVRAKTNYGRRHQIRAKAANLGHPLLGDKLYGSDKLLSEIIGDSPDLPELILHASQVDFVHPSSGQAIKVKAAQPAYLENLIKSR